jgi:hypothetical protein
VTIDAVSATIVAVGQAHFNKRSQRKSLDSLGLLPTRIRRRLSPATDSNPGDYSGLRPKQGYRSPGTKTKACRMYRVRTLAHSCHGLLPPTTNHKQENHGRSSRFWYYDIKFISWPNYSGLHPKQGYRSPGTKKKHVECTEYVRRHTPATASSRQPQTTNKRTMAVSSGFWYYDIKFISWPNLLFETGKSIVSICSGHPSSLLCIGGLWLQFSVRAVYG